MAEDHVDTDSPLYPFVMQINKLEVSLGNYMNEFSDILETLRDQITDINPIHESQEDNEESSNLKLTANQINQLITNMNNSERFKLLDSLYYKYFGKG